MPPRWGRKRCSRLCSPSPYGPRLRPCLDSLEIPFQTPLVLRQLPRSEIPPCYIKTPRNQCRARGICHCVDQNYCTTETCRSPSRCAQSNNLYCSYGNKDIEENRVCNRQCRYQDEDDSSAKDSEDERGSKTSDDEFVLTKDGESRADNLVNKPSNTNDNNSTEMSDEGEQNEEENFSNNRVRDRSKINSMMSTSDDKDERNPTKNNSHEVHCMTSFNRHMQVMQTETNTKRTRDASSMASPESIYGGNDVQDTQSLTQANTSMREHLNRNNQIKNENKAEDDDEEDDDDEERLNEALNSCCSPGHECPQSDLPLSQDDFIYPQSALIDDFYDSDDNKRNPITSTPIRKNPYPSTKIDSLRIRDSRDILSQENQSPSIPAPRIMDHSNFNQNNSIAQDKSYINPNSTQKRIDQSEVCGKGGWKCKRRKELRSSSLSHVPSRGSKSSQRDIPRRYSSGQLNQVRFTKSINKNPDSDSSIEKQKENSKRFQSTKSESNESYPTQFTGYIPRKSSPVVSLPCEGCSHGCCPRDRPRDKKDINCVCPDEIHSEFPKKNHSEFPKTERSECTRTPSCNFEDGTTSCTSATCVVNTKLGCLCHYPPAFSYLSCSGNISGSCNCSDKK